MSDWKETTPEEKENWIEVKIKIPKNTLAFIINYLEQCEDGRVSMGNIQCDSEDIEKLKKK